MALEFSPKADEPQLFDFRNGRWIIPLCGLVALSLGIFLAPEPAALDLWSEKIIPYLNLAFTFVIVPLVYIVGKIKTRL